MNYSNLFKASTILLVLFSAGLVAQGVNGFEETGLINGIVSPVWDINPAMSLDGSYPLLHENGFIGSILKGFFGYNGDPSLLEVLAYILYLGIMLFVLKKY